MVAPAEPVGMGGDRLLAAAELLARLRRRRLAPLERLDLAHEPQPVRLDPGGRIAQLLGDAQRPGDMDETSLVGRIDRPGGDRDDCAGPFGERARRTHGTPLVPEQQHDRAEDHQRADQEPGQRRSDARQPRLRRDLGEAVGIGGKPRAVVVVGHRCLCRFAVGSGAGHGSARRRIGAARTLASRTVSMVVHHRTAAHPQF